MTAPIKVAYCIDTFAVGGTELNAVRTLEGLDLDRFQVTVFHLQSDGPLRCRYDALGVQMIHLPISNLYGPGAAAQGLRMSRLLRERDISILHSHDVYTNIFAIPWARTLGRCRTIASRRWFRETARPGLGRVNRWSYLFATRVLANSSAVAKLLIDEERVPRQKVVEVPNFLEDHAFRRVDERSRAAQRRMWGIPEHGFLVGTVARLAAVKNHGTLLHALAQLDNDVHVVFIGDGPERHRLVELAKSLDVAPRVHFAGEMLSDINFQQFFDVTVLCSRSEGFPNALIEALASERPVVATAVGGVVDVISDNQTGLLFQVDDVGGLAARLQLLRSEPELRERLGRVGLDRVKSEYHRAVVLGRLCSVYIGLANPAAIHA